MFPATLASLMVGTMACVNFDMKTFKSEISFGLLRLEEATPKNSMKCFLLEQIYFWMNNRKGDVLLNLLVPV